VQENLFKFDLILPAIDTEAARRELTLICIMILGLEEPKPLTVQNVYERLITWFPVYRRIEREPVARHGRDLWKLHWILYYILTHWTCSAKTASPALPGPNENWDGLPGELMNPRYTASPLVFAGAAVSFLQSKGALPPQEPKFHKFMDLPVEVREIVIGYAFDVVKAPLKFADLDVDTSWPHTGYKEVFFINSDVRKPGRMFISVIELVNLLATFRLSHSLLRSTTEVARLHLLFGELSDFNQVLVNFGSLGRFIRSLTFRAQSTSAALAEDPGVYPESIPGTLHELQKAQQNMQRLKNLQTVTFVHFLTGYFGTEELLRRFKDVLQPSVVLKYRCEM
jgi:hypothetical protein